MLFLGDSTAAAYNSSFQPNTLMGSDPDQTVRSLRALADRLRPRRAEIRHLAFGHQFAGRVRAGFTAAQRGSALSGARGSVRTIARIPI
jgi:glyoxylase-like metal-dependent hydrolase (beta-lactamase superfamily II)